MIINKFINMTHMLAVVRNSGTTFVLRPVEITLNNFKIILRKQYKPFLAICVAHFINEEDAREALKLAVEAHGRKYSYNNYIVQETDRQTISKTLDDLQKLFNEHYDNKRSIKNGLKRPREDSESIDDKNDTEPSHKKVKH